MNEIFSISHSGTYLCRTYLCRTYLPRTYLAGLRTNSGPLYKRVASSPLTFTCNIKFVTTRHFVQYILKITRDKRILKSIGDSRRPKNTYNVSTG